jgi:hypothetical protein
MTRRSTDILSDEDDYAITLAIQREERAKIRRWAQRYLDEHCDENGVRGPGCLHVHEYAIEVGTYRGLMIKAVNAERRARGMAVPENYRWASEEDRAAANEASAAKTTSFRQLVARTCDG